MLGRLALGDYAWAYEDMLNQVLANQLPPNDALATLLTRAVAFLDEQETFLLGALQPSPVSQAEIVPVEQFIAEPTAQLTSQPVTEPNAEFIKQATAPPVPANTISEQAKVPAEQPVVSAAVTNKPVEPTPDRHANEQEDSRIIWAMFLEELPEQLQAIDQFMQDLYADENNAEAAQGLERELHTLKGGARMARLTEMGDVAHEAEELLMTAGRKVRSSAQNASVPNIELLQTYLDKISTLAEQHVFSDIPAVVDHKDMSLATPLPPAVAAAPGSLVEKVQSGADKTFGSYLEQLLSQQAAELPDISVLTDIERIETQPVAAEADEAHNPLLAQEQVRLSASYLDKMVEGANNLNIEQHTLSERLHTMGEDVGEFGRTAARLKQLLRSLELETEAQVHAGYQRSTQAERPAVRGKRAAKSQKQHEDFDPLELDEYSEIQRLSRALAESLNDLMNIEGDLNSRLRSATEFVKQSLHTSRALHHDLLATRLVEVSVLAPRLRRILRQTAAELGQKVALELHGETLKLDRHLLQRMTAPVEHLLRNAVSHGIESPQERERLQKPGSGNVSFEVQREENEVVFCIRDDGRGMDSERILQRARKLGIVAATVELSETEILRLILRPGFTTTEELNQISGRGVGMDVVNSEVKALGGNLLIESVPGKGTAFTIRLPFTMASNPVLFVKVQGESYALPLSMVHGLTRIDAAALQQHLEQKDAPLSFDDVTYSVHYLGSVLGYDQPALVIKEEAMYPVVYTRIGGEHMAWVVDAIQGRRDVILQSLGKLFKHCHFYASATITPEGQVVMIPDMLDLTERVLTDPEPQRRRPVATTEAIVTPAVEHKRPHIMVVDDSITVRKVTETFLLHENFVVETARDGLDALEKLDRFEPDLLLLDIEMPRMDGFELLGAVRAHERWHGTPVIMVSSRTAEKHREHALKLGASGFLGKPYQNQALLTTINKHLVQGSASVVEIEAANEADKNRGVTV